MVKRYDEIPTAQWSITQFRQYLADQHEAKYGIKYVARNYALEAKWLKAMVAEHGAAITRAFIDGCFAEYRPTREYPGLNFAFMYSYQRARVLPRILAEQAKHQRRQAQVEAEPDIDDTIGWL